MTLKQLEAFLMSAQLGSFAVAAARLHVTQSSLSKRIAELEADVGKRLFDRTGQRAVITEAGAQLLPFAEKMVALEVDAREAFVEDGKLRGCCRFGVSELIACTWLPRLVAEVKLRHPDLTLEPHVDLTRGLERRVERGELDFAIVPGPSAIPTLDWCAVAELEYAWMSAPSRLAKGTLVTQKELLAHPVVMLTAESTLTQLFNRWATEAQLDIPRALVCNSLLALIGLTTAGVGIGVFPRIFMRALVESGQLVELESQLPLPGMRYCFQWRRDDKRRLIELMRDLALQEADFSIPSVMHIQSPD